MTKLVIDGIQTERFNQVDGSTNYAVNGLFESEVDRLISSLYEKHDDVSVEDDNGLFIHFNYMDNRYYGYIRCRG